MITMDSSDFRQTLSRFAAGVTVITTCTTSGERAGFTATAFSSVSLDPPLVLFCVSADGGADRALRQSAGFGVSVLREDMSEVAVQFAQRGADRFEGVAVRPGPLDVPLIEGAIATLACEHHDRIVAGDHVICVGFVIEASWTDDRPLLHFRGAFDELANQRTEAPAIHDWLVSAAW